MSVLKQCWEQHIVCTGEANPHELEILLAQAEAKPEGPSEVEVANAAGTNENVVAS